MLKWLATVAAMLAATGPTERIALPAEIAYPEGIAHDPARGLLYVAGTQDGRIARIDPAKGTAETLATGVAGAIEGGFPGILGMKVDRSGRLWMAGGRSGRIFVADTRTGGPLGSIATQSAAPGLINDLAIAGNTAYFTDTLHPVIWSVRVGTAIPAQATPWLKLDGTPIAYAEGPNLNGIAATPDGRTLITGQMNKGLLFRIDIATRKVTPIDLKGEKVEGVDGLVLSGRTLFVVRQPAAEIVTIRLDPGLASGTVVKRTRHDSLAWPATAALAGGKLWVVNTQFNRFATKDAQAPFWLSGIPLAELGAE